MVILQNDTNLLRQYLKNLGFLKKDEELISAEIPGAGNMNFTLRVITNQRSFILKQSRAYVEKYPQVAAPEERCQREAEFYQLLDGNQGLSSMTPTIFSVDKANNILIMEDLGAGTDYTFLYEKGEQIAKGDLEEIVHFAASLHKKIHASNAPFIIRNEAMRKLNHEHIFMYPFVEENGLNLNDITPGLQEVAMTYIQDANLKSIIQSLGDDYLSDGEVLVHGDYFPGSWLKTSDGIRIIDPEFCFFGFPEFEMGVCIAHLMMAQQEQRAVDSVLDVYSSIASLDKTKTWKYAGIEIMRRILGLAQLPLSLNLEEKKDLLSKAYHFIK